MIELSGLSVRDEARPEGDIAIAFTGLRPGEKLIEELLLGDDPAPTEHPRILRARETHPGREELEHALQRITQAIDRLDPEGMLDALRAIVPEYRPNPDRSTDLVA